MTSAGEYWHNPSLFYSQLIHNRAILLSELDLTKRGAMSKAQSGISSLGAVGTFLKVGT